MTATMPDEFDFPLLGDAAVLAPARVVDVQGEVGAVLVERTNRLYGAGCRPCLLNLAFPTVLQNPSTSVVWSPYIPVEFGPDRDAFTIDGWGEYIEIEVVLYNTLKVSHATTGTLTVGATPAAILGTWSSVSIEVGYVRFGWRENPATVGQVARLHSLRILPDVLANTDLP